MKKKRHTNLVETDAGATDEHGEVHDSLKHVRQRKVGEIAVGRDGTDTRVQAEIRLRCDTRTPFGRPVVPLV